MAPKRPKRLYLRNMLGTIVGLCENKSRTVNNILAKVTESYPGQGMKSKSFSSNIRKAIRSGVEMGILEEQSGRVFVNQNIVDGRRSSSSRSVSYKDSRRRKSPTRRKTRHHHQHVNRAEMVKSDEDDVDKETKDRNEGCAAEETQGGNDGDSFGNDSGQVKNDNTCNNADCLCNLKEGGIKQEPMDAHDDDSGD